MSTSADKVDPERELWNRAETIAENYLDEADRVLATAIDMAFEHEAALGTSEPGDSETSRELFAGVRDDLAVERELAARVIRVLHSRVM